MGQIWAISRPSSSATNAVRVAALGPRYAWPRGAHVAARRELAEAVNAWLWETTFQRYELYAHTLARYERGALVRRGLPLGLAPCARRRQGRRAGLLARASEPCADTAEAGAHQVRTGRRPDATAQPACIEAHQEYQSPSEDHHKP